MQVTGIFSPFYSKIIEIPNKKDGEEYLDDLVIFKDENNKEEVGKVAYLRREAEDEQKVLKESIILRKMTPHDQQKWGANRQRAKEAMVICRQRIKKHNLDMHLLETVFSFDGSKVNFIFTADDRVDFRELVKDLAKYFQKQIRLQQIGPRDRSKIINGMGKCGQKLCCARFLDELGGITMDMVREQGIINKGSEKLSGTCGKLMCCLAYEVEEYHKLRKKTPSAGSIVKTKDLIGKIIALDILNQKAKILTDNRESYIISVSDIVKVISKAKEEPQQGEMIEA